MFQSKVLGRSYKELDYLESRGIQQDIVERQRCCSDFVPYLKQDNTERQDLLTSIELVLCDADVLEETIRQGVPAVTD